MSIAELSPADVKSIVFMVCLTVLLLARILYAHRRNKLLVRDQHTSLTFDRELERLSSETQHFVAVNAVLALTEQFERDPELITRLDGYADQVVAAALTYRVNSLGEQHKIAMDQLANQRRLQGERGSLYDKGVARLERSTEHLCQQLEEARNAVQRKKFW